MLAYTIVGKYLIGILPQEIRENTHPQIFDLHETPQSIIDEFCCQFAIYVSQEPPFLYTPGIAPWDYWRRLLKQESASTLAVSPSLFTMMREMLITVLQILGLKLYSLVPNLMAEERTVSNFMKINTANQARQKASTIVNMTKIKQHICRSEIPVCLYLLCR